jgi:hypothetical protein
MTVVSPSTMGMGCIKHGVVTKKYDDYSGSMDVIEYNGGASVR